MAAAHGVRVAVDFDTQFVETMNAPEPAQAVCRAARAAGLEVEGNREQIDLAVDHANLSARRCNRRSRLSRASRATLRTKERRFSSAGRSVPT